MKLVWNAIVKNEAAIIDRCIVSLLPHIDGAVIVDTGSTDGTPDILISRFRAANKPLRLERVPFENFEQARNAALKAARDSDLSWDYLLLADADMELKVREQPWLNGEKGLSYDVKQVAGSLGYYNRRLVSRDATGWYCGVTHEYLDVPSAGVLDGAEFVDHADGANRPDKFSRDIALLEKALETETRPGLIQRYHFYLAGSYFDAGEFDKAAHHYALRTTLGGYDEEVWYAQMRLARCHLQLGDPKAFVTEMLQAYQLRPQRAETLYELAKHYRERGENHTSLLFSIPGMELQIPEEDHLFVNEWIYNSGLEEEYAICAFYDPDQRPKGAHICDELSLKGSQQARGNQYWYLRPLGDYVHSFRATQIGLPVSAGWVATNPSIVNHEGRAMAIVRTVNYTITPEGRYEILGSDGSINRNHPIRTRNHLVRFSNKLTIEASHELAMPSDWTHPRYEMVIGFEDFRLFEWGGRLWSSSTVRELTEDGWCEQIIAPVTPAGYGRGWKVIRPLERRHEKNWMPWVQVDHLDFVYRLGQLIDVNGKLIQDHKCDLDFSTISGSSQVVEAEGYFIALVHEARFIPGRPHNRYYQHRFVALHEDGAVAALSPAFVFHDRQIEFAAGLAYFPLTGKLVASYGVRDCEAWLAEMDLADVIDFIGTGYHS